MNCIEIDEEERKKKMKLLIIFYLRFLNANRARDPHTQHHHHCQQQLPFFMRSFT